MLELLRGGKTFILPTFLLFAANFLIISFNFVFLYRVVCAQLYDWKCFVKPGKHNVTVPSIFPDTWDQASLTAG